MKVVTLYVNGKGMEKPATLEDGDQIQIAPRCQLTFVDSKVALSKAPAGSAR